MIAKNTEKNSVNMAVEALLEVLGDSVEDIVSEVSSEELEDLAKKAYPDMLNIEEMQKYQALLQEMYVTFSDEFKIGEPNMCSLWLSLGAKMKTIAQMSAIVKEAKKKNKMGDEDNG